MASVQYDVVVIGGGAAGLTAAKVTRGLGKKVALIEHLDHLGGECTWTGCVPSKALIKVAEIAHEARNAKSVGIVTDPQIDSAQVMEHVRSVVREVSESHTPDKIAKLGIEVHMSAPQFVDPHTLRLADGTTIVAKKFIIATGTSPFVPPISGIDTVPYLTNETLFDLKELPTSMIILGGGPIGIEMASALNRLGVKVTVIEMRETILPHDDAELVAMLMQTLRSEGVDLRLGLRATGVAKQGDAIVITAVDSAGAEQQIAAAALLVATGRKPNVDAIGLDKAGVETTKRGITVDARLQTSARHIYACGDVVGPYQFSHMAWYQAVVAARNAVIPLFKKRVSYDQVIWVTFTAPELATAGLTEKQAREQYGDRIRVYRKPYADIDRAHTDRTTNGMVKIICSNRGKIVGAHIFGARAGDIIHELQLAKAKGIRFDYFQSLIHAYPTYAELLWHLGKRAYVDTLERNPFVRAVRWVFQRVT